MRMVIGVILAYIKHGVKKNIPFGLRLEFVEFLYKTTVPVIITKNNFRRMLASKIKKRYAISGIIPIGQK